MTTPAPWAAPIVRNAARSPVPTARPAAPTVLVKWKRPGSDIQRKESILLYGVPGAGKTTAWQQVAEAHLFAERAATFWVIDLDASAKNTFAAGGRYEHLTNVRYSDPHTWVEVEAYFEDIRRQAQAGDWIVIEMLNRHWEAVQEHYFAEVYGPNRPGMSLVDWLAEQRAQALKEGKDGKPGNLDGQNDWPLIRKMHNMVVDYAAVHSPAHVLATTSLGEIIPGRETSVAPETAELLGRSVKLEGEKHNIYRFNTLVKCSRVGKKQLTRFQFETVKDRGHNLTGSPVDWASLAPDAPETNFWEVFCAATGRAWP